MSDKSRYDVKVSWLAAKHRRAHGKAACCNVHPICLPAHEQVSLLCCAWSERLLHRGRQDVLSLRLLFFFVPPSCQLCIGGQCQAGCSNTYGFTCF